MNKYPEHKTVQKCLLQIEEKLGWGNSTQWHSDVFIELSELIQKETHVLLSTTTLKRVWGKVNYNSTPSISTLNALAEFAGYQNWHDYKIKSNTKAPTWIQNKINSNMGIIVPAAIVLAIVFISLFSMIGVNNGSKNNDFSKIKFSSTPVTEDIPNSVVFDFNLNDIISDSIYIQQFWDVSKTIKISSEQNQATGIYYYPGYFRAKLLIDGTVIKEHDLFIKSNGWLATVDYEPIPKYLKHINALSLPLPLINEIKNSEQPLTSTFHYINDFKNVSGDNFRLNTSFKNTYNDKWAVCQNTTIIIVGTKSALMIPFAITGCSSNMGVMLSETFLSGKKHDLSSLALDLSEPRAIKIEAIDKELTVFAENKKLFSASYTESIGRIVGIRYRFLGAGEVNQIKISNLSESEILIDETF